MWHVRRVAATPLQRQGVVIHAAVCCESVLFVAAAADGHRTGHRQNLRPGTPAAEHAASALLERSAALAALRSLPLRQHETLVLRYHGDMSEAQMASAMGISRGRGEEPNGTGNERAPLDPQGKT
jgi:DNA-directed RNA polymerase specialized sigma24 family protein